MSNHSLAEEFSTALLKLRQEVAGCIKFGDFTLASGKKSNFYFDGRLVTLSGYGCSAIGKVIALQIIMNGYGEKITAVGGPTMGADPISAAAVVCCHNYGYPLHGFIVRKKTKDHGTGKLIEGPALNSNSRVIVVEDVVTTAGSVIQAIEAIRETGATVVRCIPLLDREEGATEALAEIGVPMSPLFRKSEFLPAHPVKN